MHISSRRAASARIEVLEQRIAPAAVVTILTPQSATYPDADGSNVYVHVSKGTLTQANFVTAPSGLGLQLEALDLSKTDFKSEFEDASVNIFAHPTPNGGDGTVDVGWINATGIDLTNVRVHGDLGRITVGDTNPATPAVVNVSVLSMGEFGVTTQAAGGNLVSSIFGGVREWTIFGDFNGATINVADNVSFNSHLSYIGHMDIHGSVIGGSTVGSGEISAAGGFKSLHIGGDLIGGTADNTGEIVTTRSILTLDIDGSLRGNAGEASGSVSSPLIRHTSIGGDVIGAGGDFSGSILGVGNNQVTYGGEIMIHGAVTGGAGDNSGFIQALNPVSVIIGGNVTGGSGADSGEFHATRAVNIRVGGSLQGAVGTDSGSIIVDKVFNSVRILRDMSGGSGDFSGSIHSLGERIGSVIVGGDVTGGSPNGAVAGADAIDSGAIVCALGGILDVRVGGSVTGGGGVDSAAISSGGSIGLVALQGNLTAGSGAGSASILGTASIGTISIFGDINGTSNGLSVSGGANGGILSAITVGGDIKAPLFIDLPVTTFKVRGSIESDNVSASGAIVGTVIDELQINGGILGTTANPVNVLLAGKTGTLADAITLLKVFGSVTNANILAGYAPTAALTTSPSHVVNSAARIGEVIVEGDWAATNLVAGVGAGADGQFGTADDASTNSGTVISTIAKVLIEGEAFGSTNMADHFGIVAQQVDSVNVADYSYVLTSGPGNDTSVTSPKLNVGPTGNFTIHEVAAA